MNAILNIILNACKFINSSQKVKFKNLCGLLLFNHQRLWLPMGLYKAATDFYPSRYFKFNRLSERHKTGAEMYFIPRRVF